MIEHIDIETIISEFATKMVVKSVLHEYFDIK
jgi:hypothetical protein